MDRKRQPCPMQYANKVSWLFFWWLNPLFSIGYQRNLEMSDVYDVLNEDSSIVLFNRLDSEWRKQLIQKQQGFVPSLQRAMWHAFGKEFLSYGIILFIEETMKVLQPVLLSGLIRHFTSGGDVSLLHAYFYAGGVSVCAIAIALTHHPYFFYVTRMGMWLRIASCSLIYKKSLSLSNRALGKTTTGQIVNLLSNDVSRFDQLTLFLHYLWIGPLQAIVVLVLLWYDVGVACLAGFVLLLLLIPLQACMAKLFSKLRRKVAGLTDERVRIMNEILSGIRVIKMYCWEHMFGDLVKNVRRKEAATIMQAAMLKSVTNAVMISTCHLLMLAVVSVLVLRGIPLRAASLFKMMSYFIQLELTLVLFVPFAIQGLAEITVTLGRIQEFLLLDELNQLETDLKPWAQTLLEAPVTANNVSATWNKELSLDTLRDVSIEVRPGELVAIVGPVGAGKSSLLMALLHELPVLRGSVSMGGSVAYAAQQPWVFSATVQQNILFGQPFDKEKYERAIRATALARDIEILPEGDQTMVGERGASLSGGQKARIGLARAVYANADIYLLDDPLSAVDTAVGRHIFDRCICGILRTKACVLVTHQLQYLKNVDRIIVLRQGRIVACGRYEQLINSGLNIAMLLKQKSEDGCLTRTISGRQHWVSRQSSRIPEEDVPTDGVIQNNNAVARQCSSDTDAGAGTTNKVTITQSVCANSNMCENEYKVKITEDTLLNRDVELHLTSHPLLSRSMTLLPEVEPLESGMLARVHSQSMLPMSKRSSVDYASSVWSLGTDLNFEMDYVAPVEKEEARQEGTVSVHLYWMYLRRGVGIAGIIVFVLLNLLAQSSYIISDWWLAYWTSVDDERLKRLNEHNALVKAGYNHANVTIPEVPSYRNLWIYTFIVVSVFVLGLLRALFIFFTMLTSSRHMHNDMFASIVRSRMVFFDTNPIGRVLNRFSKDIGQMDEVLPICMYDFVQCLLLVTGSVLVAGIVNPWVFIPTLPLTILFIYLRQYYLKTSRAIKRLEAAARSPLFSHVSASLQGLHTIRAYCMQQTFISQFSNHQDVHTSVWFLFLATSRWLAIRLDLICAIFVAVVAFCSLFTASMLSGGLVGLTLTYAISLLGLFQWMVRQSAEVENQMTSVERVYEYTKLPSEAALESSPDNKPPPNWPSEGVILAEDASFRYADDAPWVLHNLNFQINSKEKVGIVGRTGAGKSSIIAMLFRLAEPDGVLRIDGVSTRRLGLHDLRKNIGIIPQDPVLFTASVRRNIDTFNEHTDNTVWAVLQEVRIKNFIEDLPQRLEHRVSEGGVNFSVGQRQLICLARAILRHCRILVVDEATANVDHRTDALIQQTIREKFRHCTVLTIAHRLNTIMDSDRIMVLNEGQIIAFDKPLTLLEDAASPLSKMVAEVGVEESKCLLAIANGTASSFGRLATTSVSSAEDYQISSDTPKLTNTHDTIAGFAKAKETADVATGLDGADVIVSVDDEVTETSTLLLNNVSLTTEEVQPAKMASDASVKHVSNGKTVV